MSLKSGRESSMRLVRRWKAPVMAGAAAGMLWYCLVSIGKYNAPAPSRTGSREEGSSKKHARRTKPFPPGSPTRPHIVFVLADDLGQADVGWRPYEFTPDRRGQGGGEQHTRWEQDGGGDEGREQHGHGLIETPRLQALIDEEGAILMPQHYTLTMCTPTRAALMTGLHAHRTGLQHFVLLASQPTGLPLSRTIVPQLMQTAGYRTAATGKWHLGFVARAYLPTSRGFESFYGYVIGAVDYWKHKTKECLVGPVEIPSLSNRESAREHCPYTAPEEPYPERHWNGVDWWRDDAPAPVEEVLRVHSTDLFEAEVKRVVREVADANHKQKNPKKNAHVADAVAAGDIAAAAAAVSQPQPRQPLFLYVPAQTPHAHHYGTPERHYDAVDADAKAAGREEGSAVRREIAALVRAMDELVGVTVDALKAECDDGTPHMHCGGQVAGAANAAHRGAAQAQHPTMWDNTFFVFSSDNGPEEDTGASPWPLRGWKRQFWEGGVRAVTFAILPKAMREHPNGRPSVPTKPPPYVYAGIAHVVDWLPTLSEVAGVEAHLLEDMELDGESLLPELLVAGGTHRAGNPRRDGNGNGNGNAKTAGNRTMLIGYDNVLRCGAARTGSGLKLVLQGACDFRYAFDPSVTEPREYDEWSLFDLAADPYETEDLLPGLLHGAVENKTRSLAYAELMAVFEETMVQAVPPLVYTTSGEKDAAPGLHGRRWVSWHEPEHAVSAWCRLVSKLWMAAPFLPWPAAC